MQLDHDALFDACCYKGRGTVPEFARLFTQSMGQAGFPLEALRSLYTLGHIDLWRDGENGPITWRVASPSFVVTGPDRAYLQGYRSNGFLGKLDELVDSKGGKTSKLAQPDGPSLISLEGVSPVVVLEIRDEVQVPYGEPAAVSVAPHLSPELSIIARDALISQLSAAPMPNVAQVFDPDSWAWEDTVNLELSGFFRVQGRPVQYRLHLDDGRWLTASYPLGKHVAAFHKGLSLMSYNRDSSVLACPIGAPLPSPYNLVATKCTGALPRLNRNSAELEYSGVPASVAAKIWRSLYG